MNSQEIVDIVDNNNQIIGSITKDKAIQQGHYTRVVFIVLLNSKNELFLQQRKATKKTYPLYWSGSAAGHVQSGESYLDAAHRELQEELGVDTKLKEVGMLTSEIDKEVTAFFIGHSEGPFTLEEAAIETAEYYSLERLAQETAHMKMTSYLEAVIPMVKQYIAKR